MSAIRFQTSSAESEHAVSETVKRVNATALALVNRRTEIDRRIRCLHKVMKALKDLATSTRFNSLDVATPAPQMERTGLGDNTTLCGHTAGQMQPLLLGQQPPAELMRACRIALMEAEGTASLDEIRTRIARRGSFSFTDSGNADTVIVQGLKAMTEAGEVRHLTDSPQTLWQRTDRSLIAV